ncbi:MAG: MFS transporter [Myxococcales bacterium]|nr:MFS transporter [Myxococcales bacterium]
MRRSPLLPIFLIVLVDVLGMTIVIPLLAIYAERFGASPLTATLLMSSFAVCQLLSGPVLGTLSDRYGRRPILLISQLGTLAGFLILARADALWMVFAGRIIDGATAGNLAIAQAYIADHTPPEKRTQSFALIGIAFGLGFAFGPVISGWLSHHSLATPFYLAAALSACAIMGTLLILPRDEARAPATGRLRVFSPGLYVEYFRRPELGRLLALFFVYMFTFSLFIGGIALFSERHYTWHGLPFTPREIGFTFAGSAVVALVIQGGLIRRLVPRFGEVRLAEVGFLTLAVGYPLLGVSSALGMLALATLISSVGNSLLRPALTALVTTHASAREQGVVLGITQSLSSIAAISAPPLAGVLIEHGHGHAWAYLLGGVGALGLVIMMATRKAGKVAAEA